jgi:hypothetical protein
VPGHVVTGVQLDERGRITRVRWYMADRIEDALARGTMPPALTAETVVDTLEVVDKLLDAEPVLPLFRSPQGDRLGATVKVHVQPDGTEAIEVDPPLPGQRLLDLPRL